MTQAVQAKLRWGAGGVAYETRFDWPTLGAVFGVLADTLDLNAVIKGGSASSVAFPSLDVVPVLGAFMVPGFGIDPAPLRWFEANSAPVPMGASVYFAVKPFARKLSVVGPFARDFVEVRWEDSSGTTIRVQAFRFPTAPAFGDMDVVLDVPSGASFVKITNAPLAPNAVTFLCEWKIGLT
jgi:hypothetical protein